MSHRTNPRVCLAIFMFILTAAGLAQARTIMVGTAGGCDFGTIQAGIDAANDSDTVLVASGEHVITEPITFRGKAITVISEAGPDVTTIRIGTPADTNRGSVVVFENNETDASVLDGFTITGGSGCGIWVAEDSQFEWDGGGICFLDASSGTVRNCAIVQNQVRHAGGGVLVIYGSSAYLTNCIISENSTTEDSGGGVCCAFDSATTMNNCVITENSAGGPAGGGVISWTNSSLSMTCCIIQGNSTPGEAGGGVFCGQDSLLTMTDCAVIDNTVGNDGGGVYVGMGRSSGTLINCVIARNTAQLWGGGGVMCSWQGTSLTISNCTIWGNSGGSRWGGGGVLCRNASATITNSIIYGNTAPKGSEISVEDPSSTLAITYCNVAGGRPGVNVKSGCVLDWGEGNIDADPLFACLGYLDDKGTRDPSDDVWIEGDFHLKSQAGRWDSHSQSWAQDDVTSPCIDVGDPMSPIGRESFPNGGFVNMGAYGGTSEASKTYFGEPVCETIVAGDINGDGQVNRTDLEIMALHWTDEEPLPLK